MVIGSGASLLRLGHQVNLISTSTWPKRCSPTKGLEINTLPGLEPGYSEFPRIAAAAGLSYDDLIGELVRLAAARAA